MSNLNDIVTTGTPLDKMVDAILIDVGLNGENSTASSQDIIDGAVSASIMNAILHEAITTLDLAANGTFSATDIIAINQYIRSDEDRKSTWETAHGRDFNAPESGFHLVENDHANSFIFNRHIVNDVLDQIYHIGFEFDGTSFLNEDGFAEGKMVNIIEYLNGIYFAPNIITGTTGDDVFVATDAAEIFIGGAGHDIVDYSNATERMNINIGTQVGTGPLAEGDQLTSIDELILSDAGSRATGSEENEIFRGGASRDCIWGYRGDDTIFGGGGDDMLFGDDGIDLVYGGAGNDRIMSRLDGDTIDGGTGTDWLQIDAITKQDMTIDLESGVITGSAGDAITATNMERVTAEAGNDTIYGSSADNKVYGMEGDDYINGRTGNDILKGGKGNDILIGEAGNDRLEGYRGNDILLGGQGYDYLHGGDGNDTFIFLADSYKDFIYDFSAGVGSDDTLAIDNTLATHFENVMENASQTGSRVTIAFASNQQIILDDTVLTELHEDDFVFVDSGVYA